MVPTQYVYRCFGYEYICDWYTLKEPQSTRQCQKRSQGPLTRSAGGKHSCGSGDCCGSLRSAAQVGATSACKVVSFRNVVSASYKSSGYTAPSDAKQYGYRITEMLYAMRVSIACTSTWFPGMWRPLKPVPAGLFDIPFEKWHTASSFWDIPLG